MTAPGLTQEYLSQFSFQERQEALDFVWKVASQEDTPIKRTQSNPTCYAFGCRMQPTTQCRFCILVKLQDGNLWHFDVDRPTHK